MGTCLAEKAAFTAGTMLVRKSGNDRAELKTEDEVGGNVC